MKILSTINDSILRYLDARGVYTEVLPYDDIYDSLPDGDLFDVLLVDISEDKAEGVLTPRSLIHNGHTLPIVGVLDDQEFADEREFEQIQATFIDQGGLYLLKYSSSPELFRACVSQAATLCGVRMSQRIPVREYAFGSSVLKIDFRLQKVSIDNHCVHFTRHEYMILELLSLRTGIVVTKEALLGHLYSGSDMPEIKIIDVFVCKVRKKLGDAGQFIETVWGRGYTMRETVTKRVGS